MKKHPSMLGLKIIFILCMINFFAFVFISIHIGGSAIGGYIENGHYYLVNKGHFTETSQAWFNYSIWHTRSIFLTHPLAIISGCVMAYKKKKFSLP